MEEGQEGCPPLFVVAGTEEERLSPTPPCLVKLHLHNSSMADFYNCFLLQFVAILALLEHLRVECLQCYSCKATGSNELDANIKCLENAYLENCEEFYDYYNEIEDQDLISYEYYYYDKGNNEKDVTDKEGKDHASNKLTGHNNDKPKNKIDGSIQTETLQHRNSERRHKRATKGKEESENKKVNENDIDSEKGNNDEYVEYYYDYEYVDDNVTSTGPSKFNDQASSSGVSTKNNKKDVKEKDTSTANKKPMEPQHYCYNQAFKSNWESYTVEKGCKKISYCKNALEKKPEWAHPWNFCCDKSRCNVKLVKDKPQRVFGMGCRRQDDCIQGHISRTLCPHYFKSCPRISSSMIKMECRVKARTMGTVKNGAKYRHQFREKKCYCAKGYFPRGPICTSGSSRLPIHHSAILGNIFVGILMWLLQ